MNYFFSLKLFCVHKGVVKNFPFGDSCYSFIKPEIQVMVEFRQIAFLPAMFVPSWWYWMTKNKEDIFERSPWLLVSSSILVCFKGLICVLDCRFEVAKWIVSLLLD